MRIWIDMTAPAHPIVFRPIIDRLRAAGHEVDVTARDYAQNLALLERLGIPHTTIGPAHGGASMLRKAAALGSRTARMAAWGRRRGFDLAIAHGSNDLALATAALRIPEVNMFDYEWATKQHQIGCRLAQRVMTPDAIPPARLRRYGAGAEEAAPVPRPQGGVLPRGLRARPRACRRGSASIPSACCSCVRPPPDVALYHRLENPLFRRCSTTSAAATRPRGGRSRGRPSSATRARALGFPSLIVPDGAVDAQSLIALADLVVSAGGTMNREAVALGTPVYTTFSGRLGGVDEALLREGRLRRLTDPQALAVVKRDPAEREVHRRDPQLLADTMLEAAR